MTLENKLHVGGKTPLLHRKWCILLCLYGAEVQFVWDKKLRGL